MARKASAQQQPETNSGTQQPHFRFFDNREKYLMFVTTCSEKWVIAERVGKELRHIQPGASALRIFDAGMGDGTVASNVMRDLHTHFPHVPWIVVGKEISMEDVRLSLSKLADRFYEHPEMVVVITNMNYTEAPRLTPKSVAAAAALNWHQVPLAGSSAHEFNQQIRSILPSLADDWQVTTSEKTGNPMYVRPSVLVLYREDRKFILGPLLPKPGAIEGKYELMICSQPYRARTSADLKARLVLAPLARALAPSGRMITVQSYGNDPGMEIINKIWPDENPFQTGREELLKAARKQLSDPEDRDLRFANYPDERSLFQYHLHTLPSETGENIGTSTMLAAWNAAIYVAQIDDDRLQEAMTHAEYLQATSEVLRKHDGLWFNDESFVISRKQS